MISDDINDPERNEYLAAAQAGMSRDDLDQMIAIDLQGIWDQLTGADDENLAALVETERMAGNGP